MTKVKEYGKIELVCDGCNQATISHIPGTDFSELISDAKDAGWYTYKTDNGKWEYICPDCQNEALSKG